MPEPLDSIVTGLLVSRRGSIQKYSAAWSEAVAARDQVDRINALLAENGFSIPPEDAYSIGLEPEAETHAGTEIQATPQQPQQQEDLSSEQFDRDVQNLIVTMGTINAALALSEWFIRGGVVPNPATVRNLLERFTPSLRLHYNPNDTTAIETLRSQIRYAVEKGYTLLTYEKGRVGLRPVSVESEEKGAA